MNHKTIIVYNDLVVLKETDGYLLEYLEDLQSMRHILKRNNSFKEWQELLLTGTAYLAEKGITKWISDNRKNGRIDEEAAEWINETWLPFAIQSGWNTWAIVEPENFSSRLNQRKYKKFFQKYGIRIASFSNPEDAEEWIKRF